METRKSETLPVTWVVIFLSYWCEDVDIVDKWSVVFEYGLVNMPKHTCYVRLLIDNTAVWLLINLFGKRQL
jgi:hypothetical protein